jgi:WD40 repeat protein
MRALLSLCIASALLGSLLGQVIATSARAQSVLADQVPGYPEFSVDWRVEEPRYVTSLAFSPDGLLLAAAGRDGCVRLWDTRTGEMRQVLKERHPHVESVVFSTDGKRLATGGQDLNIRLWDALTGALLHTMHEPNGHVTSLAFTPDGKLLANGNDGSGTDQPTGVVRLWDVETGEFTRVFPIEGTGVVAAPFVSISPDGGSLAAGSVRVWDTRSGRTKWQVQCHGKVTSVAYSHDGHTLACEVIKRKAMDTDDRTIYPEIAHLVEFRRADTGALRHTLEVSLPITEANMGLALSPDGEMIAVGTELWDLRTGRLRAAFKEGRGRAAFSPNGRVVATGGPNGKVKLWDARSGRLIATFAASPSVDEWLTFTAQGYYRVSQTPTHAIRWRVGKEVLPIEGYQGRFYRPDLVRKALAVLAEGPMKSSRHRRR